MAQAHLLQNRNDVILHLMQALLRIEETEQQALEPRGMECTQFLGHSFVTPDHVRCGNS